MALRSRRRSARKDVGFYGSPQPIRPPAPPLPSAAAARASAARSLASVAAAVDNQNLVLTGATFPPLLRSARSEHRENDRGLGQAPMTPMELGDPCESVLAERVCDPFSFHACKYQLCHRTVVLLMRASP